MDFSPLKSYWPNRDAPCHMSKDEPSLAPQYAVSELSITVSPIWPLYQQSPCAVWQKWKTQREAGDNVRLQRVEASACHAEGLEGQHLLPSLTAVVNQANHSTPEFNAYDPNPPCSIQPLFPYTSTLTNDRTYNIITQSLYVTHTHTHNAGSLWLKGTSRRSSQQFLAIWMPNSPLSSQGS